MANTNATPRLHFIPQPFWLNVTLNSSPLTTCNAHCEKGRVFHTTKFTISGTILQDHNLDSKTWDDLLCFYGTVIRPVLEYACPVGHSVSSLAATQTKAMESLQRRALSGASVKTATTRCHWSELDSTRWSHGVNNWPSAFSTAVWYQRRCAFIICCRTSVTSPSQADCVMQEHLND